jgi:hypothetical protein
MKMTAMAFCHLSKGTKKSVGRKCQKYFRCRGYPLTKGVSHFQKASLTYKRCSPLLQKADYPPLYKEASFHLKRQNWLQPNKFLCKRIILFLYTHKLHHFIPCFVFKTCINSKTLTHTSYKLSPAL